MMVDYLSSQPDWAGYQMSTKKGDGSASSSLLVAPRVDPQRTVRPADLEPFYRNGCSPEFREI